MFPLVYCGFAAGERAFVLIPDSAESVFDVARLNTFLILVVPLDSASLTLLSTGSMVLVFRF